MSTLFRTTTWIAVAVGIIALIIFQVFGFFMLPSIQLASVVLSVLYAVIVLWVISRSRLWPRSGKSFGWVVAALIWGAGTCLPLVFLSATPIMEIPLYLNWDASLASFGGAYPEEFSKALGTAIICLAFRQINRPWHGLMVGMTVGLGFESGENLLYGLFGALTDPVSDWHGFAMTWLIRLVFGPFIHICLTGLAGWGIGWALFAAHWAVAKRIACALGWLAVSFSAHFLWNYLAEGSLAFIAQVLGALILYPTIIWVFRRARRLAAADPGYSVATTLRRGLPAPLPS